MKKLVIRQPRSSRQNEYGDEIDWEDPEIVLYSSNKSISPWQLSATSQYLVHGLLLRTIAREEVILVDSDLIRRIATREE